MNHQVKEEGGFLQGIGSMGDDDSGDVGSGERHTYPRGQFDPNSLGHILAADACDLFRLDVRQQRQTGYAFDESVDGQDGGPVARSRPTRRSTRNRASGGKDPNACQRPLGTSPAWVGAISRTGFHWKKGGQARISEVSWQIKGAVRGLTDRRVCGVLRSEMAPTLLILAAGMGSRYGGLKQIDPVGPSGETMLDYAVFDAVRAGFDRVVFVIRRDFEAVFRERVGARYAGHVAIGYAYQELEDLPEGIRAPAGRTKPWGTGHAVWCARAAIEGPFAVVNADDFYGDESFAQLASFLGTALAPEFALVGFSLGQTLSEHGAVSRGICSVGQDGWLKSISEVGGITDGEVGPGRRFSGQETVSMNCWGFTPEIMQDLGAEFGAFLAGPGSGAGADRAEFYLPAAVSALIGRDAARVRVLPTASRWFGVTYREDRPRVERALAEEVRRGKYPRSLFQSPP